MKAEFKQLSTQERKLQIHRIVSHCEQLAENFVRTWTAVNPEWDTIEGCAYLRLSTEEQVAVEKGSLEQQVNIAVSEAVNRSSSERVNYKITKFYIEPGLTGRNDRRPRFQELTKGITNRQHGFVIFKEIARIARETEIWKKFFNLCISKRCQILIRGLPFNPNDPTQVLQLDILAAFAAYESNVNSKRTKESNFSAMISSGKFNSTHKVLGLDQLVMNGTPQVGFYTRNDEEMKVVEWIMRTFVKYASYQKVLEECEKTGVKNKNGKPFLRHSLITLLTNTKYIGHWEVNEENRDERQDRLMAYDRYAAVELPHGCIIDRKLWDSVQATVKRITGNNLGKSTAVRRVNPLVGVLKFKDGTTFGGSAGWGKAGRINYYYNTRHKIRLRAEPLENAAIETVSKLIEDSPELREAIRRKGVQTTSAMQLLSGETEKQKIALLGVQQSQDALNMRLNFLIKDGNLSDAEKEDISQEYAADRKRLNAERERIEHILFRLSEQSKALEADSFDWKELGGNAKRVMDVIAEHDPVALKNAYAQLFDSIVIGDMDSKGVRPLEFVVKNENAPTAFVTGEAILSDAYKMGCESSPIALVFPLPRLSMISSIQQLPLFKSESFLREKYEAEGLSIKEIAAQISSSRTAVASHMKAYGIPIRPNDLEHKTRSQLRYGEAWRNRKVVLHRREKESVERMGQLRAKGFSYWKIADVFNSMRVPTKTGRGRWHARAIQKVLDDSRQRT